MMQPSQDHSQGSSWPAALARFNTATARRRLLLLIFLEAIALLMLGQRAMNYRYSPHVWFITWLAGLTTIVLLDFALERASRRATKTDAVPIGVLLTRRRWLVLGTTLPVAYYVWHESRYRLSTANHMDLLAIWIGLMVLVCAIVAWPIAIPSRDGIVSRTRNNWPEIAFVFAVTALAFVVRYSDLGLFDQRRRAWIFGGDEGQFALAARAVLNGEIRNPFETTFDAHPTLWLFAQAGVMRLVGDNLRGITLLSVVMGAATIPIFYFLLRRQIGLPAAIVGSTLLATFHVHIWVSRDAENNVSSPFFLALVLLLVNILLATWGPRAAIALGLSLGLADHAYVANRLLLPIAATVILITIALTPRRSLANWKRIAQSGVLVGIGFGVAVLPLAAYYLDHRYTFNARVNGVSIFANQWIQRAEELSGHSAPVVLWHHFEDAAFLPFHTIPAGHYIVRPPLIGWMLVIPGAIGIAIVSVFALRRRYLSFAVAYWAVIVGVFVTEGAPQTNRFSMGALLLPLVATIGIVKIAEMVRWLARIPRPVINVALALFVAASAFLSLRVSFDRDSSVYWPPSNGEIAINEFAYELRDRYPGYTTYFFGPPEMFYGGRTMLEVFAPENRGIDVNDVVTADTRAPVLTGPTLFYFPPSRIDELQIVQQWFPGGTVEEHVLDNGDLLYTLYIVPTAPEPFYLP